MIDEMLISSNKIVSNSDVIKNYKACRQKAEDYGRLFILKNNQPDAVLLSIKEYESLSGLIEYFDRLNEEERLKFKESLTKTNSQAWIG